MPHINKSLDNHDQGQICSKLSQSWNIFPKMCLIPYHVLLIFISIMSQLLTHMQDEMKIISGILAWVAENIH